MQLGPRSKTHTVIKMFAGMLGIKEPRVAIEMVREELRQQDLIQTVLAGWRTSENTLDIKVDPPSVKDTKFCHPFKSAGPTGVITHI